MPHKKTKPATQAQKKVNVKQAREDVKAAAKQKQSPDTSERDIREKGLRKELETAPSKERFRIIKDIESIEGQKAVQRGEQRKLEEKGARDERDRAAGQQRIVQQIRRGVIPTADIPRLEEQGFLPPDFDPEAVGIRVPEAQPDPGDIPQAFQRPFEETLTEEPAQQLPGVQEQLQIPATDIGTAGQVLGALGEVAQKGTISGVAEELDIDVLADPFPLGAGGAPSAIAQAANLARTERKVNFVISQLNKLLKTKVTKALQTGKKIAAPTETAGTYATNPKSLGLTGRILAKAGMTTTDAFLITSVIGTYPFALFIKEESLQQMGWAMDNAIKDGDIAAAEAIYLQEERILNPSVWSKIASAIPFVNTTKSLIEFIGAYGTKHAASRRRIDALRERSLDIGIQRGFVEAIQPEGGT